MRIAEIAQIEVQDVLLPSGALREEVSLCAAIMQGCRQRCVYITQSKTVEAMERYLSYRVARRYGCRMNLGDIAGCPRRANWS
jgi:site-specific recombinase XerD